jgi:hypothetical protein
MVNPARVIKLSQGLYFVLFRIRCRLPARYSKNPRISANTNSSCLMKQ